MSTTEGTTMTKPFPMAANQTGLRHWWRDGAAACGGTVFADDRLVRAKHNVTCPNCQALTVVTAR